MIRKKANQKNRSKQQRVRKKTVPFTIDFKEANKLSQILLEVTPEFQERVNFWSTKKNKRPDIFLKNIIAEYLEDLEDYEDAARISAEIKAGRMKTYSLEEVREHLGLED